MMRRGRTTSGFTAAEMLVATAIAAVVAGAAALTMYGVTISQRQYAQVTTVTLPAGALANFYPGWSGTTVNGTLNTNAVSTVLAPNFGALARAESLRERFLFDVSQGVAVYCLARNTGNYNTIRPTSITAPPAGTTLDTADAFRIYLGTLYTAASTTFVSFRNFPSTAPCFSIYILAYSNNSTSIPVVAVYDMDVVTAKDPNATTTTVGNFVSVRRYVNGYLSAYYDCCFKLSGDGTDSWYPPIVAFERQSRKAVVEGSSSIDRFKVAEEKPFYFVFWPDPARDNLRLPSGNTTSSLNPGFTSTDPRKAYNHMAGRTSFMFTLPMFPSA